jgi:hypothetical protein
MMTKEYSRAIIVIEGEEPAETNMIQAAPSPARMSQSPIYFGKSSLELDTPVNPTDNIYFSRYEFQIPVDGEYNIFTAGTPPGPGPKEAGSQWHSPYTLLIDNEDAIALTEEGLKSQWPHVFKFAYKKGGYYFNKIGSRRLAAGPHTLTLRVDQPRQHDGHYTVYLDAFIISPKDFKPKASIGKIPKDLFDT